MVGSGDPKLCWAVYVYAEPARPGISMAEKNRRCEGGGVGFETHRGLVMPRTMIPFTCHVSRYNLSCVRIKSAVYVMYVRNSWHLLDSKICVDIQQEIGPDNGKLEEGEEGPGSHFS